jgi:hypothetical protein
METIAVADSVVRPAAGIVGGAGASRTLLGPALPVAGLGRVRFRRRFVDFSRRAIRGIIEAARRKVMTACVASAISDPTAGVGCVASACRRNASLAVASARDGNVRGPSDG